METERRMVNFESKWYDNIMEHLERVESCVAEVRIAQAANSVAMTNLLEKVQYLSAQIDGNSKPGIRDRLSRVEEAQRQQTERAEGREKYIKAILGAAILILLTTIWDYAGKALTVISSHF